MRISRLILLITLVLLTGINCFAQNESKTDLVEIAVNGLLEKSTIHNLTYNFNGENTVFFQAFHDWVGTEFMKEGEKDGIQYNIWLSKHLFFYQIKYFIEIYHMTYENGLMVVKYRTSTYETNNRIPIKYFE